MDAKALVHTGADIVGPTVGVACIPALCIRKANGAGVGEQFDAPEVEGKGFQAKAICMGIEGGAPHQHTVTAKGEVG